jgi:hypothetical protein
LFLFLHRFVLIKWRWKRFIIVFQLGTRSWFSIVRLSVRFRNVFEVDIDSTFFAAACDL